MVEILDRFREHKQMNHLLDRREVQSSMDVQSMSELEDGAFVELVEGRINRSYSQPATLL